MRGLNTGPTWTFTPCSLLSSDLSLPWSLRTFLSLVFLLKPAIHLILVLDFFICSQFPDIMPHFDTHFRLKILTFSSRFKYIKNNSLIPSLASNFLHAHFSTLTISWWFLFILQWEKRVLSLAKFKLTKWWSFQCNFPFFPSVILKEMPFLMAYSAPQGLTSACP